MSYIIKDPEVDLYLGENGKVFPHRIKAKVFETAEEADEVIRTEAPAWDKIRADKFDNSQLESMLAYIRTQLASATTPNSALVMGELLKSVDDAIQSHVTLED